MKGWVGLVGWPIADGFPTLVVTHQLQVERRTGIVRRLETDVLPLCHATNQKGKTNLDFTEARDSEWQWHQLGYMQVCTSLQADNMPALQHSVFCRPDALPAAQPTVSKHWRQYVNSKRNKIITIIIISWEFNKGADDMTQNSRLPRLDVKIQDAAHNSRSVSSSTGR